MADKLVIMYDQENHPVPMRAVDNGDGSYALKTDVALTVADEVTIDTGAAITGESLEAGGSGLLGWLSSVRKKIADRLPAALGAGGGLKTEGVPIVCASADVHAPAANAAAIVTYAAEAALKHCITGIAWSYIGGIPTAGNLKVEDVSGTTVFTMDIDEGGPGVIIFPQPKKSAAVNTAMIVTLAAGGAGITGKVSVLNHWTEA